MQLTESPSEEDGDQDRRSDYVFLGKLVGLAARHCIQVPLNLPSGDWKALVVEAAGGLTCTP